ncbi:hypothetical protein GO986_16235 [Deinococcus sp. HMF7620]|uniref:Uncharacterized protein n=1 Tax=Deinococcus arboris TaxID=2682977 RepID=A0A7C9I113_9DEIO|nr:hypothetical protein [Deinococcus arboris]MVN88295.1 hypothetical protein [Deinococcus arboris]
MSWQLDLIAPDGVTAKTTRTQTNPGGVVGGFSWKQSRFRDCVQANLRVHTPTLGLRNRDLVRLTVDGSAVFYGPVVECPHPRDPSFGDVALIGASTLLDKRVIGSDSFANQDVALIVRALVQAYKHPAITYSEAHIPLTGKVLTTFSLPFRTLRLALETLGKTIDGEQGVPFGVLPDGTFFFGADLVPGQSFAAADLPGLTLLRVSGDDVVTAVTLIALSRPSGASPYRADIYPPGSTDRLPYRPATYTLKVADSASAGYGLEAAALAPAGLDVFSTPLVGAEYVNGFDSLVPASDGDRATASTNTGSVQFVELTRSVAPGANTDPMVGLRLLYTLDLSGLGTAYEARLEVQYGVTTAGGQTGVAIFAYALPATTDVRELVLVQPVPQDLLGAVQTEPFGLTTLTPYYGQLRVAVRGATSADLLPAGRLKVYEFQPIGLSRTKLDAYARKLLRPPAQVPTELTVHGLVGAMSSVTLTGLPGGDLTGDVVEIEGQHDQAGLTVSKIKLEQPGASEGARMLRLVAQERAQQAQTDLRGYLEASP